MKEVPRGPIRLGAFGSESLNKKRWVLQHDPRPETLEPEMIPAIEAIRNTGIETVASSSGLTTSPAEGWGSYIQLNLHFNKEVIVPKIVAFAETISIQLQTELKNPDIILQLVSTEKWYEDQKTISVEIGKWEFYRLQLIGSKNDEEKIYAWGVVAKMFNSSVLE